MITVHESEKNHYLLQAKNKPCSKSIFITELALNRLNQLLKVESETQPGTQPRFRIRIESGGCYGFQYHFKFDTLQNEDDFIFCAYPLEVIIDDLSLELLEGVVLDYVEDLIGASFQLKNPNAASSCGCGNSFSL